MISMSSGAASASWNIALASVWVGLLVLPPFSERTGVGEGGRAIVS